MSNTDKFESFMDSYQDMVFATAVRLLGNQPDAEDVTQSVFLKAYECFEEVGAWPTAGGWLKMVTTNLCLNHLTRYRSRWRFFSEMREEQEWEPTLTSEETDPAPQQAGLDQADDRQILEEALRKLPDTQRVPLVLFHFEGLHYEEIARQLGISVGKVKTDIHRGRLALRKRIKLHPASEGRHSDA